MNDRRGQGYERVRRTFSHASREYTPKIAPTQGVPGPRIRIRPAERPIKQDGAGVSPRSIRESMLRSYRSSTTRVCEDSVPCLTLTK
jgi:hypothetical protein